MAEQENTLADTASYDPFTIEPLEQTFERLRKLRATSPVVPLAEGMWYVGRYKEARHVLRGAEHFSNAQGFRAPGVPMRGDMGLEVSDLQNRVSCFVMIETDACPASVIWTTA
jgi:hypothetical protein